MTHSTTAALGDAREFVLPKTTGDQQPSVFRGWQIGEGQCRGEGCESRMTVYADAEQGYWVAYNGTHSSVFTHKVTSSAQVFRCDSEGALVKLMTGGEVLARTHDLVQAWLSALHAWPPLREYLEQQRRHRADRIAADQAAADAYDREQTRLRLEAAKRRVERAEAERERAAAFVI